MGRKSAVGVNNGNYRGGDYYRYRLAVEAGKRGMLSAEEIERMTMKKKMRGMYWAQRLSNAMGALYQADPTGWEAWYDNDQNIPAEATDREFALRIEARVRELTGSYPEFTCRTRNGIFIWKDKLGFYVYSKEVGQRKLYTIDFNSFEDSTTFVNGLPFANRGYGVVLDLLPAGITTSVEG